jgi:hypothetical protein
VNLELIDEPEPGDDARRLFSAWMTVIHAEVMLGHLATAGASWP